MENHSSQRTVVSNLIWRFLERIGAQGVMFLVSIVLARLLDPAVYGTIALITVFTAIMEVFIDSGLGNALIQKKDADNLDFSSVFYFNIVVCIVLYSLMFFASPVIAHFYKNDELIPVIRVLSLSLIISGVKNVQQAYVSRHLLFKKFFFATLTGTIGAAIIGIWMVYRGYGVWALVAQNLFNQFIDTLILWFTVKWRPNFAFSWTRLRNLLSFGWKLLCSALINTVYTKLRQLIIGRHYSSADLAYYTRGDQFPNFIVSNINTSIDSVLFPALSKAQESTEQVRIMTRKAIKTSTFVMMPFMFGLAAVATPLVKILLTEKWLPCVFFLRIFCFVYAFQPLQTANLNAIKAMGRSDLFLKLEIIKKAVGLTAMFSTIFISVEAMAYSYLFTTVISVIINSYPNRKLLNYPTREQIKDILPSAILSGAMFIICYLIQLIPINEVYVLVLQVVIGAFFYIGASLLLRFESALYLKEVIVEMKNKLHNR